MTRLHTTALLLGCCVGLLPAQTGLEHVGFTDTSFANPTTQGSAQLDVRVYYPALQPGQNMPLKVVAGGWPSTVFLHGLGFRAADYDSIGTHLAERGYIAVLNDTAQFQSPLQFEDAVALFPAIAAENQSSTAFFGGAFDMSRIGLTGHSMGGGNTVRTLASNPGYVSGASIAPWGHGAQNYPANFAPSVAVPLLVVQGEGDQITNWQTNGLRFYELATSFTGIKTMYLMNQDADHHNVAITNTTSSATDLAVFARCAAVLTGFLDAFVKGDPAGLEQVVGPPAQAEPRLTQILRHVEQPAFWRIGSTSLGGQSTFRALGEAGVAGAMAALSPGSWPTPFGLLLLDPNSALLLSCGPVNQNGLLSTPFTIPTHPSLVGVNVLFQGIATEQTQSLRMTDLVVLTIDP